MRNLILVLMCLTLTAGSTFAQNKQKIGHLNSDEILILMPEAKMIDDSLKVVQKSKQNQVALLQAELQEMAAEFENSKASMDPTLQRMRLEEIQSKSALIEEYVEVSRAELLQIEQSLMEPLRKRVVDAINKVAEENEFSYLIDTASGAVLYVDGGIDAGDLVKTELGIPLDAKPPGAEGAAVGGQ